MKYNDTHDRQLSIEKGPRRLPRAYVSPVCASVRLANYEKEQAGAGRCLGPEATSMVGRREPLQEAFSYARLDNEMHNCVHNGWLVLVLVL
jgi:hypothetical protein